MAQESNQDLKKEIDAIKISLNNLHSEIQSVKSENIYLKKVLKINQPILEKKGENTIYKIINVVGDKDKKSIFITLLIEPTQENEKFNLQDLKIFDINGNEIGVEYVKSDRTNGEIYLNTPKKIKLAFVYDELPNDYPRLVKLLVMSNSYKKNSDDSSWGKKEKVEFKDLNVTWN
ncbi:hypothetical protein EDM00_05735 [Ornithobacterium rhinotracheale]|nr:hypothetical protein [Ornithobacterium rhinotracheale]